MSVRQLNTGGHLYVVEGTWRPAFAWLPTQVGGRWIWLKRYEKRSWAGSAVGMVRGKPVAMQVSGWDRRS